MRFLIPHILTSAVLFIVGIAAMGGSRIGAKDKNGNSIVKMPKVLFWIGLFVAVGCTLLLILMYCFPNSTAHPWVYCVFSLFDGIGCYLMHLTLSWKITYSNETDFFVYRSIILQSRKFCYRECHCRFEKGEVIITSDINACKIHIPKEAIGFDHFIQIIRQRCK